MFTIEQIKAAHSKVKSGADFPNYIQEIKKLGVVAYETFVSDGHSSFLGQSGHAIQSEAKYAPLAIADNSDHIQFQKELKEHQQGKTDYPTFCRTSAHSGVEKWVVEIEKMTCTYYNKAGKEILTETIPTL
jgi:uncharacterized protein YbcV (DUF1398 family)